MCIWIVIWYYSLLHFVLIILLHFVLITWTKCVILLFLTHYILQLGAYVCIYNIECKWVILMFIVNCIIVPLGKWNRIFRSGCSFIIWMIYTDITRTYSSFVISSANLNIFGVRVCFFYQNCNFCITTYL